MATLEEPQPYTKNFDTLIALVTYLGGTDRTKVNVKVKTIADGLGLVPDTVEAVLKGFPGFFRQVVVSVQYPDPDLYSLILRYARSEDEDVGGKTMRCARPLDQEEFSALLDLISKMVAHEKEWSKFSLDLKHRDERLFWTNMITMIAAFIAAAAAIMAAIIK